MELSQRLAASQSDRIIGLARLPLIFFVVMAIWLDPSQPAHFAGLTYVLLPLYGLFSLTCALLLYRPPPKPMLALLAHLVDLGVFSFLVYTTEGPASPFFLLFNFSIISAAFRWRWRGALWTSLTVLALQVLSAITFAWLVPETPIEVDRFLIRCAHIIVIGGLLVYFTYHQERISAEARNLRPISDGPWYEIGRGEFLQRSTRHVAEVFRTDSVVLVFEDPEEPSPGADILSGGSMSFERIDPDIFSRILAQTDERADWISTEARWQELIGARSTESGELVKFGRHLAGDGLMLSLRVRSARAQGHLFIVNPRGRWWDVTTMAGLQARQIGEGIDMIEAVSIERRASVAEDLLRIARDLHDGVLQTLAGTAMQLENLAKLAVDAPKAVPPRIQGLQDWLITEQQELRRLIRSLRPGQSTPPESARDDRQPLHALADGLQSQWGIRVILQVSSDVPPLAPALDHHVRQIVREAAANATRHGGATEIVVTLRIRAGGMQIILADNGCGLPFKGNFKPADCLKHQMGSRSLRERITGLGGELSLTSSSKGLELRVYLPQPSEKGA